MTRRPRSRSLLVTGAGGVGKTTISAALGIAAARSGTRTLVLTVDPARRLADALGLEHLGNDPTPVQNQPHLWAAMLDVTASWEAIIHRHTDPEVAARLEDNAFFRAIADRFPAAQAYAAGEQLAEYLEAGAWELIVVDTPPAGGGIDFFQAPGQMRELVGGMILRVLTGAGMPGRRALYRITARPVLRIADNVLGGALLQEFTEFLMDLRTLYDGLSRRATHIERYLRESTSLVVTTANPTPLREARRFFEELTSIATAPAAVVFNRALPDEWTQRGVDQVLSADFGAATARPILRDNFRRWAAEARRQQEAREEFAAHFKVPLATVPWAEHPPTTLDALAGLMEVSDGLPELALVIPT